MLKIKIKYIVLFLLAGCIEPYDPPIAEGGDNLLVVNANINATDGVGEITLSRTQNLASQDAIQYVSSGVIELEHESGEKWSFVNLGQGRYRVEGFDVGVGEKARIRIIIDDASEYVSDYETVKATPPIDSISYDSDKKIGGVKFYVSTHDPDNNTTYYKWDYEEDWEFNSKYPSLFHIEIINGVPEKFRRNEYDTMYICYKHRKSTDIIIGSSEKLSQDVISEHLLGNFDGTNARFSRRYSLLVKQRALNESTYNYWDLLKSNTEDIGGLFDPQPFKVASNINSVTKESEDVVGYFNLFTEEQMRIFVTQRDVDFFKIADEFSRCEVDTVLNAEIPAFVNSHYFITEIYDGGPSPVGLTAATLSCMDCRFYGTNKKPDFWPN